MTKVDIRRLDSVTTNDTTATQLINDNFEALQTAIENTLSRDGSTPNFMDANLDLNSYKIINAGTPTDNSDVITKEYFDQNVGNAAGYAEAAAQSAQQAATSAQSASGFATVATGAANIAQAARDFIESDPGFQTVSADLLLGENGQIYKVNDNKANIDTVADNVNDVNTVAGISSNVTTVADISTDVTTTADIANDVTTVANISSDVTAVASNSTDISAVADDLTNINTVAGISSDVTTVADIASDVTAVANNNSDISTVADDLTNIDAVSSNITNVNTVADISSDVTTVAGIASDVSAVEDIASDITTVAGISTDVSTVAASASNIATVITDLTNIDTVAADINSVVAVAADLTNIDNASSYAAEAKQWAIGEPTEPTGGSAKYWAGQAAAGQVQADWTEADTTSKAYIKNKPTIPTVNNATLTITQNGSSVGTFTANASSNVTIATTDTTYSAFTGADGVNAGTSGLVPAPTATDNTKYLKGDGTWDSVDALPSQTGQSGKFLTTDGTDASWANVDALPSQTGQSGKFLTTDGTDASWATVNVNPDNKSITLNGSSQLQTVGVIDQNNTSTAVKTWTGTKAQYDALVSGGTVDSNTLYNITDDTDVSPTVLEVLYPVGSIYITTADSCPLSTLISGSTWVQEPYRQLVEKKEATDNDPTWYNLYSDGWCVQGGKIAGFNSSSLVSYSVTFSKEFADTNYNITTLSLQRYNSSNPSSFDISTRATTGFSGNAIGSVPGGLDWEAKGYTSTTTSHKQFRRTA